MMGSHNSRPDLLLAVRGRFQLYDLGSVEIRVWSLVSAGSNIA
jgi:hypothetical protein